MESGYNQTLGSPRGPGGQGDRWTRGPRLTVGPGPGQVVVGTQGAYSSSDAQSQLKGSFSFRVLPGAL